MNPYRCIPSSFSKPRSFPSGLRAVSLAIKNHILTSLSTSMHVFSFPSSLSSFLLFSLSPFFHFPFLIYFFRIHSLHVWAAGFDLWEHCMTKSTREIDAHISGLIVPQTFIFFICDYSSLQACSVTRYSSTPQAPPSLCGHQPVCMVPVTHSKRRAEMAMSQEGTRKVLLFVS